MEKPNIATQEDILGKLTDILNRDDPEGKNLSTICRAAELLGKFYGLFDGQGNVHQGDAITIIDDVAYQETYQGTCHLSRDNEETAEDIKMAGNQGRISKAEGGQEGGTKTYESQGVGK